MIKRLLAYNQVDGDNNFSVEVPKRNTTIILDKNGTFNGYIEFPWIYQKDESYSGSGESLRTQVTIPKYISINTVLLMRVSFYEGIKEKKLSGKNSVYYGKIVNYLGRNLLIHEGESSGTSSSTFRWRGSVHLDDYTYYPCGLALDNFALLFGSGHRYRIRQRSFPSTLKQKIDYTTQAFMLEDGGEALQSFGAGIPESALIRPVLGNLCLVDVIDASEINSFLSADLGLTEVYFEDKEDLFGTEEENYWERKKFYLRNGFPDTIPLPGDKIDDEEVETIIFKQDYIEFYVGLVYRFLRQKTTGQTLERKKLIYPRNSYFLGDWFSNMPTTAILGKNDEQILNPNSSDISAGTLMSSFTFSFLDPLVYRFDEEMRATKIKARVKDSPSGCSWKFELIKRNYTSNGLGWTTEISQDSAGGENEVVFENLESGAFYVLNIYTNYDISPNSTTVYYQYWVDPSCLELS